MLRKKAHFTDTFFQYLLKCMNFNWASATDGRLIAQQNCSQSALQRRKTPVNAFNPYRHNKRALIIFHRILFVLSAMQESIFLMI